jgi:hypothetical protein
MRYFSFEEVLETRNGDKILEWVTRRAFWKPDFAKGPKPPPLPKKRPIAA